MNARMSFFVTRPPAPVPGTVVGSTPCSPAMRATTGETKVRPFPADAATGAVVATAGGASALAAGTGWLAGSTGGGSAATTCSASGTGAAGCSGAVASGGAASGGAAASLPAGPIRPTSVPTSTVCPSATRISRRTPSPGLGTSVSTLSVEISSSGSSRAIASPGCLSHFVIVPSETDTPICGITTSIWVPVDTCPPRRGEACLALRPQ